MAPGEVVETSPPASSPADRDPEATRDPAQLAWGDFSPGIFQSWYLQFPCAQAAGRVKRPPPLARLRGSGLWQHQGLSPAASSHVPWDTRMQLIGEGDAGTVWLGGEEIGTPS